jgi:hypothetical protein
MPTKYFRSVSIGKYQIPTPFGEPFSRALRAKNLTEHLVGAGEIFSHSNAVIFASDVSDTPILSLHNSHHNTQDTIVSSSCTQLSRSLLSSSFFFFYKKEERIYYSQNSDLCRLYMENNTWVPPTAVRHGFDQTTPAIGWTLPCSMNALDL